LRREKGRRGEGEKGRRGEEEKGRREKRLRRVTQRTAELRRGKNSVFLCCSPDFLCVTKNGF
jgi:hypothetical protein